MGEVILREGYLNVRTSKRFEARYFVACPREWAFWISQADQQNGLPPHGRLVMQELARVEEQVDGALLRLVNGGALQVEALDGEGFAPWQDCILRSMLSPGCVLPQAGQLGKSPGGKTPDQQPRPIVSPGPRGQQIWGQELGQQTADLSTTQDSGRANPMMSMASMVTTATTAQRRAAVVPSGRQSKASSVSAEQRKKSEAGKRASSMTAATRAGARARKPASAVAASAKKVALGHMNNSFVPTKSQAAPQQQERGDGSCARNDLAVLMPWDSTDSLGTRQKGGGAGGGSQTNKNVNKMSSSSLLSASVPLGSLLMGEVLTKALKDPNEDFDGRIATSPTDAIIISLHEVLSETSTVSGLIGFRQLQRYAILTHFEGGDADWHQEYIRICASQKWPVGRGLSKTQFAKFLAHHAEQDDGYTLRAALAKLNSREEMVENVYRYFTGKRRAKDPDRTVDGVGLCQYNAMSTCIRNRVSCAIKRSLNDHWSTQLLELMKTEAFSSMTRDEFFDYVSDSKSTGYLTERQLQQLVKDLHSRDTLVTEVFLALGGMSHGILTAFNMRGFARFCDFGGTDAEWMEEFKTLCFVNGWKDLWRANGGIGLQEFLQLITENDDFKHYTSDYALFRMLIMAREGVL